MIAALMGTLAFAGQGQASAPSQVPRWSLDVEPARCVLQGQEPGSRFTLSIDTIPGSDSYRLAVAGADIKPAASLVPASLTFAPSGAELKGFARTTNTPEGTPIILMAGVAPSLLDDLTNAESITITAGSEIRSTVPIFHAAKAVEALRRCNADQLIEWGADPTQFAPGGKGPIALKDRDYWVPDSILRAAAGQSKRSLISDDFRVTVATDGTVSNCQAVAGVTEAGMEKSICSAVMTKRLFTPARDANNGAVRGIATFRVMLFIRPR